jgi:ABC-type branched-subunit amino acid transport system permease subunit
MGDRGRRLNAGFNGLPDFRHPLFILLGVAVLLIVTSGTSLAGAPGEEKKADQPIYQYTDQNGGVVFTDDPSRIPAEARSTAKTVDLPPLIKIPDPTPQPTLESPSLAARIRAWNAHLPPGYRLILTGILPAMMVILWGLSVLRQRTDSAFIKLALRAGMLAVVLLSASVCYVIFVRVQAATLTGTLLDGHDLASSLQQKAEEMNRGTVDLVNSVTESVGQK